ncbi:MAG TPA: HNH endonuclease [Caulobacteraceae bacterium]
MAAVGSPLERLLAKVEFDTNGGCWLIPGAGRPQLKIDGKRHLAARASWIIHFGPIPDGMEVLHWCDVACCVRPTHLWLGTQSDNIRDCVSKGRWVQGMARKRLEGATPRRTMTKARRAAAFERAGGLCQGCGCSLAAGFQADHVLPLGLGGKDEDHNIEALCIPCHGIKTKADIAQMAKAKRQRGMSEPRGPSRLKGRPFQKSHRKIPTRPFPKRSW